MPVCLLTFHAYRSWMPDHPEGYVRRGEGVLPTDEEMDRTYRNNAMHPAVRFTEQMQRELVEEAQRAAAFQRLVLHAVATDPTHAHLLLSWEDGRSEMQVRRALKTSLTRRLKHLVAQDAPVFSDGGHHRTINCSDHLGHLLHVYLPDHRGVYWSELTGWREARRG